MLYNERRGNPAFPNFGRNLHVLAESALSSVRSLEALNSVRFPRRLSTVIEWRSNLERR
jgi:hypothetical protein